MLMACIAKCIGEKYMCICVMFFAYSNNSNDISLN